MPKLAALALALALAIASTRAGTEPAIPTPAEPAVPTARRIAPGVYFLPGAEVPGPDGNSVVFTAPRGLVVFDTGRHPEHAQRLVALARKQRRPIAAIVNSHWHLDHVGGNLILRGAYPHLRIYASDTMDGALHGFLAEYRNHLVEALGQDGGEPEAAAGYRAELELIDAGARLGPDETITAGGQRLIAGLPLQVGLATRAVTAGDVWVLEPQSGVLAAGDLVTLPVPFFDTACPRGWQLALDDLATQRFTTLVPGHGAPMTAPEVASYRSAFRALLDCAVSSRPEDDCVDAWFHDAGPQAAAADGASARGMLHYYFSTILRGDPTVIAKLCREDTPAARR